MHVFVLNTGRCGSVTFYKACSHITNFTCGHETKTSLTGRDRLRYSDNHIEVDNRLSWLLGRLDGEFGDTAFYVHLFRDADAVARSYSKRAVSGIAFAHGIMRAHAEVLLYVNPLMHPMELARDMVNTVRSNIQMFLKDKTHKMNFKLENYKEDFPKFWAAINAQGDYQAALDEFLVRHNASPEVQ